jgi:hypothetical protein
MPSKSEFFLSDKPSNLEQGLDVRAKNAYVLRENTGTSGLELTVCSAAAILADHDIPHLIAGGLAVQEHGYFRVTLDADIIVPDVLEAVEMLTADLSGPFERYPGCEDTVRDRRNGVRVNFLPAGSVLKAGCRVPFPTPSAVTELPEFVTLPKLISLKLDSWVNSPNRRLKDKADVIELIKALKLPRDLPIDEAVRQLYIETWDALQSET